MLGCCFFSSQSTLSFLLHPNDRLSCCFDLILCLISCFCAGFGRKLWCFTGDVWVFWTICWVSNFRWVFAGHLGSSPAGLSRSGPCFVAIPQVVSFASVDCPRGLVSSLLILKILKGPTCCLVNSNLNALLVSSGPNCFAAWFAHVGWIASAVGLTVELLIRMAH